MIFYDCNAKISKYIIITTQYVKRELTLISCLCIDNWFMQVLIIENKNERGLENDIKLSLLLSL